MACRQPVARRLTRDWLEAVLSRYRGQRVEVSLPDAKGAPLRVCGVYVTLFRSPQAGFQLVLRKARATLVNGTRVYVHEWRVPVQDILQHGGHKPFWRALYKQLVGSKLVSSVQGVGGF